MVYGCGSFIITFEESVVNFSLQNSNMKGGSGNVEERENIRERLKKHKLSYVWLIARYVLTTASRYPGLNQTRKRL